MTASEIKELLEYLIVCSAAFGIAWKWLDSKMKNKRAIAIEALKQNSLGEEKFNQLFESLKQLLHKVGMAENKVMEIEKDWHLFREEVRTSNDRYLQVFKEWAEGLRDTRDYINKNRL